MTTLVKVGIQRVSDSVESLIDADEVDLLDALNGDFNPFSIVETNSLETLTGALLSDTPIIQYTVQNEQYVETLKEIYNLDLDDADIANRKGNLTDLESDLEPGTYVQHLMFFSGDMTFESNEDITSINELPPKVFCCRVGGDVIQAVVGFESKIPLVDMTPDDFFQNMELVEIFTIADDRSKVTLRSIQNY